MTHPVITTIRGFSARKHDTKYDLNLSDQGRQLKTKQIDAEFQAFRGQALATLESEWQTVRRTYAGIEKARAEAENKAALAWDYNRLNYEAAAARAAIASAIGSPVSGNTDVSAGERLYRQAMQSGDKHKQRAWAETVPDAILSRFGLNQETGMLAKDAQRRLADLLTTDEMRRVQAQTDQLHQQVDELLKATREADQTYNPDAGPLSMLGLKTDFQALTEGVSFTKTLADDSFHFVSRLEITEPQAA
jgi:hypothetical protein